MSKTKIALIIVTVFIVIVSAICLWIYYQPRDKPEFEIVSLEGIETPAPYGHKNYQIVFKLKNLGTGDATGIHGTIKLGLWNQTWQLYPEDYVLKSGETSSSWVIVFLDEKPEELTVTIIVNCNEGVTQQFTDSLPP